MPETKQTLDEMADEVFVLFKIIASARSRGVKGPESLTEAEFLTLDLLAKEQPLTIGEVQKRIGVVPAQMSRIVRTLESGGKGFIDCRINVKDRRRTDLLLTHDGEKAHETFRAVRLASMRQVLEALEENVRYAFMCMQRTIRDAVLPSPMRTIQP